MGTGFKGVTKSACHVHLKWVSVSSCTRKKGKEIQLLLLATIAISPLLAKDNRSAGRLNDAAQVLADVMAAPNKGIPQEVLDHARCLVIVPDLKTAAFVVGGKYGTGYLRCRNKSGVGWSAQGTVRIEGGSVSFQRGGSSPDWIMLVMNEPASTGMTTMSSILNNAVTLCVII